VKMKNKTIQKLHFDGSIKRAYFNYLFTSFWKRPVGYVIAIIYILYLACILIIVPKAMGNHPLFIWNLSTFNIPIFSLFFIGASCAALAVTVFRISKEDGTELSLSAKPLTKGSMVGIKVIVYLIIMLAVCVITIILAALIKPIFGTYSSTNSTGISDKEYRGIILSMFVGNLIVILFFSGVSILISLVGGQVITMITSIGIAFVMVMLNFIFAKVVKAPGDIISDRYSTSIRSISTFTRKQIESGENNLTPELFAGIQCYVNEEGEELNHYDTYEYWLKAESASSANALSYIDLGNQLSSLYTSFGLEDNKVDDVKKMPIGDNATFKYKVDQNSHITKQENIDNGEYPICIFAWTEYQGKYYPIINTLGPALGGSLSEWYLFSSGFGMDFNAVTKVSTGTSWYNYPGYKTAKAVDNDLALTIDKVLLTNPDQIQEAETLCDDYIAVSSYGTFDPNYFNNNLHTSTSGIWEGEFANLDYHAKYLATSKLMVQFMIYGQEKQFAALKTYLDTTYPTEPPHTFPFSTAQVVDAYRNDNSFHRLTLRMHILANYSMLVGKVNNTNLYCMLNTAQLPYCESYNNLYKYTVSSLYSTPALIAVWSIISITLFAVAIVVYKKTDFK